MHIVCRIPLICLCLSLIIGCYSFKGISIDPNDKTFYVRTFETQADNAPPTLALEFTERLKDKVRSETSLSYTEDKPHLEFSGKVVDYRVELVAPKPGEVVAQNRLVIRYRIQMINNQDEKRGWASDKDFSFFSEFSNTTDLLSVQDALVKEINTQILEDVFNAAFNNW